MDSRILSMDPETGITEIMHYDEVTHDIHIERRQLLELDEFAKASVNAESDVKANRWKGEMHHVASVPMTIVAEWMATGMIHDQAALRKWLNDPDNQVFRFKRGRV